MQLRARSDRGTLNVEIVIGNVSRPRGAQRSDGPRRDRYRYYGHFYRRNSRPTALPAPPSTRHQTTNTEGAAGERFSPVSQGLAKNVSQALKLS